MKCISRSTLGVVIGSLNVLVYIIASIFITVTLINLNAAANSLKKDQTRDPYRIWNENEDDKVVAVETYSVIFIIVLVLCFIMAIISGLLIMGIVKKRHSLMAPWLILSAIAFVGSCLRTVVGFFGAIAAGADIGILLLALVIACLGLGLHALILYPIYTLYKDIRNRNNGQVIAAPQIGFTNVYPAPPAYYAGAPEKTNLPVYSPIPEKA